MKILIAGDSFAANWFGDYPGWVDLLAKNYQVTNLAQAGCSEYKIRQQLECNLKKYNSIIVCHTSNSRIPVEHNPLHKNDLLHKNCDFLYSDVKGRISSMTEFYEKYYHHDFWEYTYNLIVNDIVEYTLGHNALHITFFDHKHQLIDINLHTVFKKHPGTVNHLSDKGNQIVYNKVLNWIKK